MCQSYPAETDLLPEILLEDLESRQDEIPDHMLKICELDGQFSSLRYSK